MAETTSLMERLSAVQQALKVPKSQENTFGHYKYRNTEDILEAVKPHLVKHNLALTLRDELVQVGERYYVKATAVLSKLDSTLIGGNELEVTAYAREEEDKKGMDGSQITGAASSYARKYALNGLFLIDDTKDSDATNDHSKAPAKPEPAKTSKAITPALMDKLKATLADKGITGQDAVALSMEVLGAPKPESDADVYKLFGHLGGRS